MAAGLGEVIGAPALFPDFFDGAFDEGGFTIGVQALAEEHGQGEDLGDGIGAIGAGEVVGGAMAGLIDSAAIAGEVAGEGEAAGAQKNGGEVGEHITDHVGSDQDVELLGMLDELVCGMVGIEEGAAEAGVIGDALGHVAPEGADGRHAAFLDNHVHVLFAGLGEVCAGLDDAGDLVAGVREALLGDLAMAVFGAGVPGALIDAAGVVADDEDIDFAESVGFEAGGVMEDGGGFDGGELAEEVKAAAEIVDEAAAAGAAEQDAAAIEDVLAEGVDVGGELAVAGAFGGQADVAAERPANTQRVNGFQGVELQQGGGDDFGADAFAGKDADETRAAAGARGRIGGRCDCGCAVCGHGSRSEGHAHAREAFLVGQWMAGFSGIMEQCATGNDEIKMKGKIFWNCSVVC